MKRAVLGSLVCVGLVMAAVGAAGQRGEVFAQRVTPPDPPAVAGGELIVVPATLADKGQMLTVVDPRQKVVCVYHIDLATGKIALRSVRKIHWDLQMTYMNNENPLPQEIQSLLEQK
jgi:hypothetical protein